MAQAVPSAVLAEDAFGGGAGVVDDQAEQGEDFAPERGVVAAMLAVERGQRLAQRRGVHFPVGPVDRCRHAVSVYVSLIRLVMPNRAGAGKHQVRLIGQ